MAVLADKKGTVLGKEKNGSSSWRNVGIEVAAENVFRLIRKISKGKEVSVYCIALAAVEEEHKDRKEEFVKKLREKGLKGEVFVVSDQLSAFRAGTDKKDGVVLICGTGAVARGWKRGREEKASGWGYLADEGAAFYTGIEGYRAIQKSLDGRGEKTKISDILFREWKIKTSEELNKRVYGKFMESVPFISIAVGKAGDRKDKVAISILEKGAKEAVLSLKAVVEKLNFQESFPVVLTGGMFNSKVFLSCFKKETKKIVPEGKQILLKKDPAEGAVKLALEKYKELEKKHEL